jgi:hypothetical protein
MVMHNANVARTELILAFAVTRNEKRHPRPWHCVCRTESDVLSMHVDISHAVIRAHENQGLGTIPTLQQAQSPVELALFYDSRLDLTVRT